jgi:hypothetical protein
MQYRSQISSAAPPRAGLPAPASLSSPSPQAHTELALIKDKAAHRLRFIQVLRESSIG